MLKTLTSDKFVTEMISKWHLCRNYNENNNEDRERGNDRCSL